MRWYKNLEAIKLDIQKMFFSLKGRLNRKPYFFGNIVISLISTLFSFIMDKSDSMLIALLGMVIGIAVIAGSISLLVKRLHDLDKGGLWALIMLIPIVNFFFGLYLLFAKGTDGYNQYGEDPLKNF